MQDDEPPVKNVGFISRVELNGVGEERSDNRGGEAYRTIVIGDPRYRLALEIRRDSPLYGSRIQDVRMQVETDKLDPLKELPELPSREETQRELDRYNRRFKRRWWGR
ncbi:MAG: hypothetical protein HY518_01655, partial [Candidatus Aenigmarchaeota archaeon]|nr:hypothetical protein [Candidatus Aenigmarchaeota archaeon]